MRLLKKGEKRAFQSEAKKMWTAHVKHIRDNSYLYLKKILASCLMENCWLFNNKTLAFNIACRIIYSSKDEDQYGCDITVETVRFHEYIAKYIGEFDEPEPDADADEDEEDDVNRSITSKR